MDLNKVFLRLNKKFNLTIINMFRHVLILGGTGSGKTSGPGRMISLALLRHMFSGIVLCAKVDELDRWKKYATETGRLNDLIIMEDGGPHKFNFIDYLTKRLGGADTLAIVDFFMKILQVGGTIKNNKANNSDPYWENAMREALKNAIDLIKLSGKKLTLINIIKAIKEAPVGETHLDKFKLYVDSGDHNDQKELHKWAEESFTISCLAWARSASKTHREALDFNVVQEYFLHDFSLLPSNTRFSVLATLSAFLNPFRGGLLAEHFTDETTPGITPEEIVKNKKILILFFPIKQKSIAGLYAQNIYKTLFFEYLEGRDIYASPNPSFVFADECQHFLTPADKSFVQGARSQRAVLILIAQNLPTIYSALDSNNPKDEADAILGAPELKIFTGNSCPITNEWASRIIGHTYKEKSTYSFGDGRTGGSFTKDRQYFVEPNEFLRLRTGSEDHNSLVDAILTYTGKGFDDGKPYLRVVFNQNKKSSL